MPTVSPILRCERCGEQWTIKTHPSLPRDSIGRKPIDALWHITTRVLEFSCNCGAPCMVPA